jgi:hypothetical protein
MAPVGAAGPQIGDRPRMVPIDPLQPVATGSYWKAEKMNTASWHMKDQIIGLYFDLALRVDGGCRSRFACLVLNRPRQDQLTVGLYPDQHRIKIDNRAGPCTNNHRQYRSVQINL